MIKIVYGEHELICQENELLLDALLNQGHAIPNSCRQGVCQSCLMRSNNGAPPALAQKGLRDVQKKQHLFLACQCYPEQSMQITSMQQVMHGGVATVVDKVLLNANTVLLKIQPEVQLNYYAGQFVNLKRADGLTRSYSIANSNLENTHLTFHIRRLPGGQFSEWVYNDLLLGDTIDVSEPQGLCFYLPERLDQNLLLIGTGTGLAPLIGIISEALQQGHCGEIHLFHGSRDLDGLYWVEEMRALEHQHTNFHYTPCVSQANPTKGVAQGRANDVAMQTLPDLKGYRVYLCGHPDMVNQTKIQAFMNGARSTDIYSDAFHVQPK